jgi:hypothetical protein
MKTLAERFWEKVEKTEGCWRWTGAKYNYGYGKIRRGGKTILAHRVSWILHKGPIPEGMCVCHHCDNPPCTNPAHLFLGTHQDNAVDRERKGRGGGCLLQKGEKHPSAKLTKAKVDEARARYEAGEVGQRSLAREYGVDQSTMSDAINGLTWQWGVASGYY